MTKALYAGSFDPLTNGHMHVIETASEMFDTLYVAVAENEAKKPAFDTVNRVRMLDHAIEDAKIKNVEVVTVRAGEFAAAQAAWRGCGFLVRGVRGASDLEAEVAISGINSLAAPDVETVVLMSPRRLADVSSSTVRGLTKLRNWRGVVRQMVPASTMCALEIVRAHEYAGDKVLGCEPMWKRFLACYTEPHRAYHGIGHIVDCLDQLKMVIETGAVLMDYYEYKAVARAIWYHDAVYDPKAAPKSNEEQSARMTTDFEVHALVLATAHHFDPEFAPTDLRTQLLLDIDLSPFAAIREESRWLSKAIRREYEHVPVDQYVPARVALLRQLLGKPHIYRTPFFRTACEERARENIAWEIYQLESGC